MGLTGARETLMNLHPSWSLCRWSVFVRTVHQRSNTKRRSRRLRKHLPAPLTGIGSTWEMFHMLNFNHWHHLKTPPQTHVSAFVMKTTKKILSASPLTAGPLHQSPAPCGISVIETGNDPNPNLCACFKCCFLSFKTKCELEGGVWRCLSYRTMFWLTVQCRRFGSTRQTASWSLWQQDVIHIHQPAALDLPVLVQLYLV